MRRKYVSKHKAHSVKESNSFNKIQTSDILTPKMITPLKHDNQRSIRLTATTLSTTRGQIIPIPFSQTFFPSKCYLKSQTTQVTKSMKYANDSGYKPSKSLVLYR